MENMVPPSYEEATTKNHWDLVAAYIPGPDLCAACRVCTQWHHIFAPWLWGDPASHFGSENDRVYVALTRFKRALPYASPRVRQLTHTLHLPPALSEIYDGPKPAWLRDVLDQLPNLQSLIVSQLPFFDHSALLALRQRGRYSIQGSDDGPCMFSLRLLIASKCLNATSTGLVEVCMHLPNMVFLDLSWTPAGRDATLFFQFRSMRNLQVLKLRGIGLRDDDVELLASCIGVRVRSLDVSSNKLTDASIDTLLARCFHAMTDIHSEQMRLRETALGHEDWPTGFSRPNNLILNQLRESDLDEKFLKHLTTANAGRMLTEDLPRTGITHLYISGNFITIEGLLRLIKTENLHVLDASDLERPRSKSVVTSSANPGSEKLAPIFERHGTKNLTYLRIHHSIVTEPTDFDYEEVFVGELDGNAVDPQAELEAHATQRAELDNNEHERWELDAAVPLYELPEEISPRYELPSDPMSSSAAPLTRPALHLEVEQQPQVNRGAVFAPEAVDRVEEEAIQLTATGFVSPIVPSPRPFDSEPSGHSTTAASSRANGDTTAAEGAYLQPRAAAPERISQMEGRRREIRRRSKGLSRGLLPGALPSLRALVLTDVPIFDDDRGSVIKGLKRFISECALETQLALSQAALELSSLHISGRPRYRHKSHRAHELFGLTHLILEMGPSTKRPTQMGRSLSQSSNGSEDPFTPMPIPRYDAFNQQERSSTGDPDSEAFWRAQQHDFSFFGDEECGLPVQEPGQILPRSALEGKFALASGPFSPLSAVVSPRTATPTSAGFPAPAGGGGDVVAELAQWRRAKKLASKDSSSVEGHWRGEIKIVRPSMQRRRPTYSDAAHRPG